MNTWVLLLVILILATIVLIAITMNIIILLLFLIIVSIISIIFRVVLVLNPKINSPRVPYLNPNPFSAVVEIPRIKPSTLRPEPQTL